MQRFLMILTVWLAAGYAWAEPPVRLISTEQEKVFRQALPTVDDPDVAAILAADDLIFYTEREIPKAYQFSNTFHSPYYNISGEPDPFGNGNREFPWDKAGGTQQVRNLEVFRFMRLPKKPDGGYWPIVYWNEQLPATRRDGGGSGWRWQYPKGTVFGELLGVNHNGYTYPFELRLRTRQDTMWDPNVFKPYATADQFAEALVTAKPDWSGDPELAALVQNLKGEMVFPKVTMRDASGGNGFLATVAVNTLPPIRDDELVGKLLIEKHWVSALGTAWRKGADGTEVFAPTVAKGTGLHIVPETYAAHGFEVEPTSCMNCHRHTNKAVSTIRENRGWYGRIRGSDGIFSFHPISRNSIAGNGAEVPVQMNAALVRSGVVAAFNQSQHPREVYKRQDKSYYDEGR